MVAKPSSIALGVVEGLATNVLRPIDANSTINGVERLLWYNAEVKRWSVSLFPRGSESADSKVGRLPKRLVVART
jgi:hypothetical protein